MLRWWYRSALSFNAKNVLKMFSFYTIASYELHCFSLSPGSEAWSWINLKNGQNYRQLHPEPDPNGHNNWWTGRLRAGQSVADVGHGAFTWYSGGLTQKWWVQLPDWWVDLSSVSILWAFILNGRFGGHNVNAPHLTLTWSAELNFVQPDVIIEGGTCREHGYQCCSWSLLITANTLKPF